jgi:DNA-directed RNA polymerase sigma subunit (sigma70/sigma32)
VLTARLADEVAAVGPRPERLSDLIEELERQQRVSRGAEHQPSPAAHGAGLPPSELRDAMAQVDQARREIKRVRERMVKAHLRLVASIARKYRQKARWTFSI